MIHELIIVHRLEDGYVGISRANATGVNSAVLLHTMLEGAIRNVRISEELTVCDAFEGCDVPDCQYVMVMYHPENKNLKVGVWGLALTLDECCGILSAAKEVAHDIAQRNKMMKMVREEIKQILGPDGQPMRSINDG